MNHRRNAVKLGFFALALLATPSAAQQSGTSPMEQFGHEIGADYVLFNYTQLYDYWHTLADESARMTVHDFGLTSEGRPQIMAIITSPQNHRQIERYQEISARLAHAEGVSDDSGGCAPKLTIRKPGMVCFACSMAAMHVSTAFLGAVV